MGDAARRMMAGWSEGKRLELGFQLLDEEIQRVADGIEDLPDDPRDRAQRIYEALRAEDEP